MAKQLQLIHDEIIEKKMEIRDIKELYKSTIEQMDEHAELVEKIAELRNQKKQLELKAQESLGKSWEKFEDIKREIMAEREMMTDVALNDLMAGKTVVIKDKFDNEYEPKWTVKFVKKH